MNPFYDENFYYNNFNPQMNPMNQVIPLVYQIRPIINNTKNAFRVIQAVNHINDIDFDEVEQNITPIDQEKKETKEESDDVKFENMVQ